MTKAKVHIGSSLEYIQQKIVNITRPSSVVWNAIENVKNDLSEEITLSLEKFATSLDLFVLLMEQASQSAAYHHHYNIFFSVIKYKKKLKEAFRETPKFLVREH